MATRKREEPKGRIDFDHLGIGTALQRNRLIVPVNQREYSWEEKHVLDLFHDFSKAISSNKSSYFLGTIVLTAGDEDAPEVADGQQRLATTTILLAAIRDYLHNKNEELLVRYIEDSFLFKILPETKELSPRLSLNLDDNDYFQKRILSRPDSDGRQSQAARPSHRRINHAANLASKHVEDILRPLGENAKVPHLTQWVKFIEHTAQVIVLQVPDDLNAFVMFETLNDRGLKTSQADLLKNYLLGEADDRIAEAQQRWATMLGIVESQEIEDLTLTYLRHLVSSLHGLTRDREVFEKIKSTVAGKGPAINFLGILADHANDYVAILNPEHSKWNTYNPSIRNHIRTMNLLQGIPIRPLLLAVARNFTPSEAEKSFRAFVSWIVRFLISGGGRGSRVEEAYAERAKEVNKGKVTTTKQLVDAMVDILPKDAQFADDFAIARVSKSGLARYYLRSLELKVKGSPEPELIPNDDPVINLEHVLPEHPGENWGHIEAETASAYYRRLGNMVLLQATKNNAMGNGAFADKRSVLKASAYFLTSEVGKHTSWGTKEINERQKRLADLAVQTWPIDGRQKLS
jgi:Protein of unknown function DUF262/Protein of unknown function (DUF1524)